MIKRPKGLSKVVKRPEGLSELIKRFKGLLFSSLKMKIFTTINDILNNFESTYTET